MTRGSAAGGTTATDLEGLHLPAVVVGAGQAGLSASHHLSRLGVEHLVLERDRAFGEWRRRRWDSFCLVTPNWQCRLPDWPYRGPDPDGFMDREELLRYFDGFLATSSPPLVEGVTAIALRERPGGGLDLVTSAGRLHADAVVVANGPYTVPVVPRLADHLPAGVLSMHSGDYRNPDQLPPGAVLVVGTGQSGCQIAEDLHLAGRRVHLATGSAPRVARRYRGRDVVAWLEDMGHYATTITEHADPDGRRRNVNHYVSGRDGGHDIDLRAHALTGMGLHGHLLAIEATTFHFDDDLADNLDRADRVAEDIKDSIDAHIARLGLVVAPEPRRPPVWTPEPGASRLDAAADGISTVLWATGFRPDHGWIDAPVFDGLGRPDHLRGVTAVPGLYFLGLPWLHTWGSARLSAVAADAEHVAGHVAGHLDGEGRPSGQHRVAVPS